MFSMRVCDLGLDPRIAEILAEQGIEDLYPPQAEAVGAALAGKSLVLAIPTASGKSLVAYLALLKSVLNGGKAMYIVPLRALASEKYEDLRAFEKIGIKVGISVGDYDSPDPTLARYDILVATSERADSLLRHRADWLTRLTVVVADEVHLINDADRGPTLEVTLAKIRQVNPRLQIIALSATIRNSAELAAWLEAEHVHSDWRPVPLRQGVMYNGTIMWTDRSVTKIRATEDDLSGLVEDTIGTAGQALIFVNTRRSSEALAKALTASVKPRLKEKEMAALEKISEDLVRQQEEATSMANRLARCVEGGTAFHNAGLLNDHRHLIEESFKKGKVKVITATPTLCLHPDTMITTRRGPVRISEILQGDEVLTHYGRFRRVLGTTKRSYEGNLLEIRCNGMVPVLMTPEHRILRNARYRYGCDARGVSWHEMRRSTPDWCLARELNIGDEVQSPVESPEFTPDGGALVVPIHDRTFVGRNQFGSVFPHPSIRSVPQLLEVDETVARFLGLYVTKSFTGRNGANLTKFIAECMEQVFHAVPTVVDGTRHRRQVRCCSRVLAESLDRTFGRRTVNKHFPEYLVHAPLDVVRGLVRGAWEGDGTTNPRPCWKARFSTVSPRLAEQMLRMLKRLGYLPSVRRMRALGMGKRPSYHLALSGTQGRDFLVRIMGFDPSEIPRGNRTYNAKNLVDGSFRSPVRRIRKVPYSGVVYNLHVEGDESYVCSFAFAVHNSAGINLPARRVIVRDVNRFDVNLGFAPIPVLEIQQMCGRAGRPKYDKYGEAILMAKREEDMEYFLEHYLLAPPEPIESKLGMEPSLRSHLLAVIATGHCRNEDELYGFLARTFFAFKRDVNDLRNTVERVLTFLEKEGLIRTTDGLRPTLFGRRTSDLYIDPLSAVKMRDALKKPLSTSFFHLWGVCSTPDMPKLYLRRGDTRWVEEKIVEEALTFPIEDYDFFLAEIKTASLLEDWIEERTEEEITKKFGIGPGDIRRLIDVGQWLVYSMAELGRLFNKSKVRDLSCLTIRLQYGVKEELLPLVELRGVGRVRARALLRRGYRTLRELQAASVEDLAGIPSIGPGLAKSIKQQLGQQPAEGPVAGQTSLVEF